MKKILLLINSLSNQPSGDEADVLVQAAAVEEALDVLGIQHSRVGLDLDLDRTRRLIFNDPPDLVFNLVESLGGKGSLIHLCPSLLEAYGIPFTGSGTLAMYLSTDKIRAKNILQKAGILTPHWIIPGVNAVPDPGKTYILKPVKEDGSAGITDASVIRGEALTRISFIHDRQDQDERFLEEYIEGREFNLSILEGPHGPEVMPPAEMQYIDYPPGKPRILNYASKWEEDSFEYHQTIRTFEIPERDRDLVGQMYRISLQCFELFEMRGYARVDFRVNGLNHPYVLEVNANPCLSPDAGFPAACAAGGVDFHEMIHRIITYSN